MKPGTKVALMVIALFALMVCAWTALFYAANQAHVESVPLAAPVEPVADRLSERHRPPTGATPIPAAPEETR
jgi:hypothetical protein